MPSVKEVISDIKKEVGLNEDVITESKYPFGADTVMVQTNYRLTSRGILNPGLFSRENDWDRLFHILSVGFGWSGKEKETMIRYVIRDMFRRLPDTMKKADWRHVIKDLPIILNGLNDADFGEFLKKIKKE